VGLPSPSYYYYTYSFISRIAFCVGPVDKLYGYRVDRAKIEYDPPKDRGTYPNYYAFPTRSGCDKADRGKLMRGRLYWGTSSQNSTDGYLDHDLNYRGVCYFAGEFCLGGSPSPAQVVFDLYRKVQPLTAIAAGSGDHLNPVQIIYDILTNDDLLGISVDLIDKTSFETVGTTLANEGIYVSVLLRDSNDVSKTLKDLLELIDGKLYWKNGKITLKLLRYESSSYTLDDSQIKDLEIEGKTWAGIPTGVSLEWVDPDRNFETNWMYVVDHAAMACANVVSVAEFSYDFIFTKSVAEKIVERKLSNLTFPRMKVKFKTKSDVQVYDVFRIDSDLYDFTGEFRAVSVTRIGILREVEAIEEISLGTATISYQSETAYSGYEDFAHDYPDYGIVENAFQNIFVWVERDASNPKLIGADVTVKASDKLIDRKRISHGVIGTLKNGLGTNTYFSDRTLEIEAEGEWFNIPLSSTDEEGWWNGTNVILVDNELMFFKEATETSTGWRLTGLIRGVGGTDIATHNAGTRVIYIGNIRFDVPSQWIGTSLEFSIVPIHWWMGNEVFDSAMTQTATFSWQGLRWRPLPVWELRVDDGPGTYVPPSTDATFKWYITTRNGGAGTVVPGSTRPGDGTLEHDKIVVKVLNLSNQELREVELSATATSWTYTTSDQTADGVEDAGFKVRVYQVGTYWSPAAEITVSRS